MNEIVALEVKKEEEAFMNQIIASKGDNLPGTIEDVVNVFEFTDFKAKAFKLLSDKMLKLEEQNELYHSALRSSQKWSIASLYAQKRMGEITRNSNFKFGEKYKSLSEKGIERNRWETSEQISKHPEILEQVIEHAKKTDEVPTKTAVLKAIKEKKDSEWRDEHNTKVKEKYNKKMVEQVDEAVKDYLDSLKGFKSLLDVSIVHAEAGKFSPESKNFIIKKHNEIKKLMSELEDLI